ncbi:MAG: carbohydrate ABC transporter permease [Kiritimatiellales bacterium]
MNSRKRHVLFGYAFTMPYLLLFLLFLIAPLVFGLALSFFNWEMLSLAPPKFAGLNNYREALHDPYFWKALKATCLFVVMAVPLTLGTALLLALGVNSLPRRQGLYRATFVLPTMINIAVAGLLWRWFYNNEFGLFNALLAGWNIKIPWLSSSQLALPAIVLMTIWWTAGGAFLILMAGLSQIPRSCYEAAAIDGAIGFWRFAYITLPLLRPSLFFVAIMSVIGSFQVFGQTYVITGGGPELSTRVLVQYIYETSFHNYRMGYGAAMSWLLFLVIAMISCVQLLVGRKKDQA